MTSLTYTCTFSCSSTLSLPPQPPAPSESLLHFTFFLFMRFCSISPLFLTLSFHEASRLYFFIRLADQYPPSFLQCSSFNVPAATAAFAREKTLALSTTSWPTCKCLSSPLNRVIFKTTHLSRPLLSDSTTFAVAMTE